MKINKYTIKPKYLAKFKSVDDGFYIQIYNKMVEIFYSMFPIPVEDEDKINFFKSPTKFHLLGENVVGSGGLCRLYSLGFYAKKDNEILIELSTKSLFLREYLDILYLTFLLSERFEELRDQDIYKLTEDPLHREVYPLIDYEKNYEFKIWYNSWINLYLRYIDFLQSFPTVFFWVKIDYGVSVLEKAIFNNDSELYEFNKKPLPFIPKYFNDFSNKPGTNYNDDNCYSPEEYKEMFNKSSYLPDESNESDSSDESDES